MTQPNRFRVPLSDLTEVHVEQAELVEDHAQPRVVEDWSGPLGPASGGGGPTDADGE